MHKHTKVSHSTPKHTIVDISTRKVPEHTMHTKAHIKIIGKIPIHTWVDKAHN